MRGLFLLLPAALFLTTAWADDKKAPEETKVDPAVARGKKIFERRAEEEYPSCADCHGVLPPEKEAKEAKHFGPAETLYGSARRAGWRNSDTKYKDIGEAYKYCAKTWQKLKKGYKAAEHADLVAYLKSIGGDKALPMRKVERKPKLMSDIEGGDAKNGLKLTARYCGQCHHNDSISFPLKANKKKNDLILRKVRGYDAKRRFKPTRGTMAYYPTTRLSDKELRDIIAHLGK